MSAEPPAVRRPYDKLLLDVLVQELRCYHVLCDKIVCPVCGGRGGWDVRENTSDCECLVAIDECRLCKARFRWGGGESLHRPSFDLTWLEVELPEELPDERPA